MIKQEGAIELKNRASVSLLSKLIVSQIRQGIVHVLRCLKGQIFAWIKFREFMDFLPKLIHAKYFGFRCS